MNAGRGAGLATVPCRVVGERWGSGRGGVGERWGSGGGQSEFLRQGRQNREVRTQSGAVWEGLGSEGFSLLIL